MPHKIGRNDPCPCGSGKKYRFCHGQPGHVTPLETTPDVGWQVGDVVDLDNDDFDDDDDWPDVELPHIDDLLFGFGRPF